MKVSVVIPCYNRSYIISKAIDSVLRQTYAKTEIIIVDDCSTDTTEQIISEYISKHSNIKYIKNKTNLGAAESRNVGVASSNGELIAFLDSDDVWMDNKLELQVKALTSQIDMIGIGRININENTGVEKNHIPGKEFYTYEEILKSDPIGSNSGPLIRKKAFERVGGYDAKLPARQDWDLWIRISENSRVKVVNDLGYKYYYGRDDQISSGIKKKLIGTLMIYEKYKNEFFKNKQAHAEILNLLGEMYIRENQRKKAIHYMFKSIKLTDNISVLIKRIFKLLLTVIVGTYNTIRIRKLIQSSLKKETSYLDR
ncbi:glycosyl transferase family 2 [Priestia megaterium]|uniref:glycosyltransferase family 2 protein n=1 Tax=Priestia megaterium TaxID=1404 RepID=UPI000BFD6C76|nr:glycosyltransferase family A protein [Priestia megaterium]PGK31196.1 glycosyl transferase family 2 [Priestia megaterium]